MDEAQQQARKKKSTDAQPYLKQKEEQADEQRAHHEHEHEQEQRYAQQHHHEMEGMMLVPLLAGGAWTAAGADLLMSEAFEVLEGGVSTFLLSLTRSLSLPLPQPALGFEPWKGLRGGG